MCVVSYLFLPSSFQTASSLFHTAQWAYWDGLRIFEKDNHDYLQSQIGNPTGPDKPNKKYYDPRVWIRMAEESMVSRVMVSCQKLGSQGIFEPTVHEPAYPQLGTPKKGPSPVIWMTAGALVGSAATLIFKVVTK